MSLVKEGGLCECSDVTAKELWGMCKDWLVSREFERSVRLEIGSKIIVEFSVGSVMIFLRFIGIETTSLASFAPPSEWLDATMSERLGFLTTEKPDPVGWS